MLRSLRRASMARFPSVPLQSTVVDVPPFSSSPMAHLGPSVPLQNLRRFRRFPSVPLQSTVVDVRPFSSSPMAHLGPSVPLQNLRRFRRFLASGGRVAGQGPRRPGRKLRAAGGDLRPQRALVFGRDGRGFGDLERRGDAVIFTRHAAGALPQYLQREFRALQRPARRLRAEARPQVFEPQAGDVVQLFCRYMCHFLVPLQTLSITATRRRPMGGPFSSSPMLRFTATTPPRIPFPFSSSPQAFN